MTAVSVIIAVKNAEAFLAECLDSVVAQTVAPLEILLVDGGSTDGTAAIAARYPRTRLLSQTGKGFADAWNCGIAAATGDYLAFIDSDDRWVPRKLEWQAEMLDADPALLGTIGHARFFLEPGHVPPRGFRDKVLEGSHLAMMPGTLMARRALFDALGQWGSDWRIVSDIDWFLKWKDSGLPMGVLPETLIEKRVHDSNLSYVTASDRVYPSEMLKLLRASILRKRAAAE